MNAEELSPNSAVPLSSTEHFSIYQLIVLFFYGHNFTVLVHCQRSQQCHFQTQQVDVSENVLYTLTTPNACLFCSVSAGCVNKHIYI